MKMPRSLTISYLIPVHVHATIAKKQISRISISILTIALHLTWRWRDQLDILHAVHYRSIREKSRGYVRCVSIAVLALTTNVYATYGKWQLWREREWIKRTVVLYQSEIFYTNQTFHLIWTGDEPRFHILSSVYSKLSARQHVHFIRVWGKIRSFRQIGKAHGVFTVSVVIL